MRSAFLFSFENYEFFVNKRGIRDKSHLRDRNYDNIEPSKIVFTVNSFMYT